MSLFISDARLYRGRGGAEGPQLAAAGAALAAQLRAHAARQRHARLPARALRQVTLPSTRSHTHMHHP